MPRKILFIACYILLAHYCSAQEVRELKWQDFMNSVKTTQVAKPVKTGEFTIFQISDINKFLYRVEIAGRVFELQTPVPTELQTLFRLTPQQLEQQSAQNNVQQAADVAKEGGKDMSKLRSNLVEKAAPPSDAESELTSAMGTLVSLCEKYAKAANQLALDVFALKRARNKLVLIAQSDRPFTKIREMLNEVVIPDADAMRRNYQNVLELYHKVEAAYETAKDKAKEVKAEADKKVKAAAAPVPRSLTDDAEAAKENLAKITEAANSVEEAHQLITEEALLSLADDVEFLYGELGNKNNFNVVSPPVQMDGDMITYTVTITPAQTRAPGPNKSPMQFRFDIPAKRGLKVDFGVGPAISFGNRAKDEQYYFKDDYQTNPDPTMTQLKRLANKNEITPGIAAMMHVYPRSGKWVGIGGSFGVGAGFQDQKNINVNVYTGLCLVFGKREKIMLSGGVGWLRVNRIKEDQFTVDNLYKKANVNLTDVTEKVFVRSFFLGITYSLSNKVEMR